MSTLSELYFKKELLTADIRHLRGYAEQNGITVPYQDKFASKEYLELTNKKVAELNEVLAEIFKLQMCQKGPDHFTKENVWVWGGPTPSWGGSMAKDASITAAKFFDLDNIMYVYGPLNEEMMEIHKDCKKVICHLGKNCRTAGAQSMGDVEEAEYLSKLSTKYKFLRGGVVDDMLGNYGHKYNHDTYKGMHDGLKKYNPDMELYGVVYVHELDMPQARAVADCIDRVILWTWDVNDLVNLEANVEKCRNVFPGKKIMMGVFMFDYGLTVLPNTAEAMKYQLSKAKKFLQEGKLEDLVILGDREIEKCPEAAEYIKNFFANEFKLG